jgi:hypothetical protein
MININSQKNKSILFIAVIVMMTQMVFAQASKSLNNGDERVAKLKTIAENYFLKLDVEYIDKPSYSIKFFDETDIDYQVTFIHNDEPKGMRGGSPTTGERTIHIDKKTLKVIRMSSAK